MENVITYEQPLSETYRACLRLEHLFGLIDYELTDTSFTGTRNTIALIINVLQLLDRPDLKSKLAKELGHQTSQLMRLESLPQMDKDKLHDIVKQLEDYSRNFIDSNGKIGQNLRDVGLLNNLRLHLTSPGGGLNFDIPVYHYWLHQPAELRMQTIQSWLLEFQHIRNAIKLLLRIVRESSTLRTVMATHGFYQELLDPQQHIRLIRVSIASELDAFPEISIGRHFVSIRFFSPHIVLRPTPYQQNISFGLAYCNL